MANEQVDKTFEARLGRMFAEAPAFGDVDLFAVRVSDWLDCGWTVRGAVIRALGIAGGMVVVQATSAGVIARVRTLPDHSSAANGRGLDHVLPWRLSISGLPFAGDVIWIPAALAAQVLGLVIVRAIREI